MTTITEPTLLVDEKTVRRNIRQMADKATRNKAVLKPHFKTHQSIQIGRWMRDSGIEQITVSSVAMAEYFAQAGWDDITIAFPCNPLLGARLNELARHIRLSVLLSDAVSLPKIAHVLTADIQVYIEIDTGSGRTGFLPSQINQIEQHIQQLQKQANLTFRGFYSHPGHTYQCRSTDEIQAVHQKAVRKMKELKNHFRSVVPDLVLCMGDTPGCSVGTHFEEIDEMSAGNFVFYDLMQQQIGACSERDIAVALACPVVATYPGRNEIVIHGGAVHLSKEVLVTPNGRHFGKVVMLDKNGYRGPSVENCFVKTISQEHGIIQCAPSFFETVSTGDIIGILPVHSCLTADAMAGYTNTRNATKIDHMQGFLNNIH